MEMLVKILGILLIVEGIMVLINPSVVKRVMAFVREGSRIYIPAVLRIVLGVIFLLAASSCTRVWIIIGLGILVLVSGIAIFAMGHNKFRSVLDWWLERDLNVLRIMGVFAIGLGALIIYAA